MFKMDFNTCSWPASSWGMDEWYHFQLPIPPTLKPRMAPTLSRILFLILGLQRFWVSMWACQGGMFTKIPRSSYPWRSERLPTPVFWPGEFHGLYSPWGPKESDMTKQLSLSYSLKGMQGRPWWLRQ